MTGWYGQDRRGYQLATVAIGSAIAGTPAPFAAGITVRGIVWASTLWAETLITAVVCAALLVIGGALALATLSSADHIARARARGAILVVVVTLAVGIPIGFFFAFFGDPGPVDPT
jgi:hypothetical protein